MGLPISDGVHSVNVYIVVGDSEVAIDPRERAFGAETIHAEAGARRRRYGACGMPDWKIGADVD